MKVLVCGGRNLNNCAAVWGQLDAFHASQGPITVIIHGGARGVDLLAAKWAIRNNIPRMEFRPDWQANGRAAGPMRNARMLKEAKPDMVIAFPGGRGTADMKFQADEANIRIINAFI